MDLFQIDFLSVENGLCKIKCIDWRNRIVSGWVGLCCVTHGLLPGSSCALSPGSTLSSFMGMIHFYKKYASKRQGQSQTVSVPTQTKGIRTSHSGKPQCPIFSHTLALMIQISIQRTMTTSGVCWLAEFNVWPRTFWVGWHFVQKYLGVIWWLASLILGK